MAEDLQGPETQVGRTSAMIAAGLADIKRTYDSFGGGGISEIRQTETFVYQFSLPQEERTDLITYRFEVAENGAVRIVERTMGTKTP